MKRVAMLLLILYSFAVPWEYSLDLGESLGNVARITGLLLLATAIPTLLWSRGIRTPGVLQWLVLGFYLFFLTSYLWTADQGATLEKMRAYFQVMMSVWMTWEFVEGVDELRSLFCAYVAGCWLLAILTIMNFLSANPVAAGQMRYFAEGQDPNDVARFLDLAFPFATLILVVPGKLVAKTLAGLYIPVGMLAVLLTASRGGFSGSVVSLLGSGALLLAWRGRTVAKVLFGLAAAAGFIWFIVPSKSIDRLATIPEQISAGDLNDRLAIWSSGWQAFRHAPWLGYGAGNYATASNLAANDTAHNTGMAILVTGGLVGSSLFIAILLAVCRAACQATGLLQIALATILLTWTITAMVGSVEENRTTWLLFAMIGVAGRLSSQRAEDVNRIFAVQPSGLTANS